MAFTQEKIKVNDGFLIKEYTITDEAKACELAIQMEMVEAIKDLTRAIRRG